MLARAGSPATRKSIQGQALRSACKHGNLTQAVQLLAAGADVNAASEHGLSALIWACIYGHHACARLLAEHGAAVDSVDIAGDSALTMACIKGHWSCVELLIEHKANINAQNAEGFTPLMNAIANGHDYVCHLLSMSGADRTVTNHDGATAEDVARAYHPPMAEFLERSRQWVTPLHHFELLSWQHTLQLLQAGADPHARVAPDAPSPLDLARAARKRKQAPEGSPASLLLSWCSKRRAQLLSMAMGLHPRLGAESMLMKLDSVRDDTGRPSLLEQIARSI